MTARHAFDGAFSLAPFFSAHGETLTIGGQDVEAIVDRAYHQDTQVPHRPRKPADISFVVRTSDKGALAKGQTVQHDGISYTVLVHPIDDGQGLTEIVVTRLC